MGSLCGHLASLTLAGLVMTIGCGDARRPMSEKDLVSVIVDLHILDARRELVGDTPPALRDSVLAEHGISPAELRAAIEYYADRPDEYVSIYNQVIDSLSAEEAELEEAGVIEMLPPP